MSDYRERAPVPPPPAPPRRALLFPLALVVDGSDVVARRSRRTYVARGLVAIVALPLVGHPVAPPDRRTVAPALTRRNRGGSPCAA